VVAWIHGKAGRAEGSRGTRIKGGAWRSSKDLENSRLLSTVVPLP
jgi:hypothetical protein